MLQPSQILIVASNLWITLFITKIMGFQSLLDMDYQIYG